MAEKITMHDAWEYVEVTREQAAAIFDKMAELLESDTDLAKELSNAASEVQQVPPEVT
jgi:hypothetical protein